MFMPALTCSYPAKRGPSRVPRWSACLIGRRRDQGSPSRVSVVGQSAVHRSRPECGWQDPAGLGSGFHERTAVSPRHARSAQRPPPAHAGPHARDLVAATPPATSGALAASIWELPVRPACLSLRHEGGSAQPLGACWDRRGAGPDAAAEFERSQLGLRCWDRAGPSVPSLGCVGWGTRWLGVCCWMLCDPYPVCLSRPSSPLRPCWAAKAPRPAAASPAALQDSHTP